MSIKPFESTGVPTPEMIAEKFPPIARIRRGRVALAECYRRIPCNPCETACPNKAITVGADINDMPVVDFEKCTGCGLCLTKCPGLAIMLVAESDGMIEMSIPHEFSPLPEAGDEVAVLDREGRELCRSTVTDCRCPKSFDKTPIVRFRVEEKYLYTARAIRVIKEA